VFDREFTDLLSSDRHRLEGLTESAVRELLVALEGDKPSSEQLFLKCANIRAVFKLAAALRRTSSTNR
jgi:hypothetical protein